MNWNEPTNLKTEHSIKCQVIFGSPSKKCKGSGICQVIPTIFLKRKIGTCCKVQFAGQKKIQLQLKKCEIPIEVYQKVLKTSSFFIPEQCPLPFLSILLGAKTMICLQKGSYPLIEANGDICLLVDLTKQQIRPFPVQQKCLLIKSVLAFQANMFKTSLQ